MTEWNEATMAETDLSDAELKDAAAATFEPEPEFNPEASIAGAAAFASAESLEILNLLGDAEGGGACCSGGSCACAA